MENQSENNLLKAILEANEKLNDTHVLEPILVEIKTEEDQMFWFNMCLYGWVRPG